MEQGLRLELPKSQVTDASEKNDLKMVEVDPSENYFLETQPVSLSTLREALAAAFEQNRPGLVIRGIGATWTYLCCSGQGQETGHAEYLLDTK